MKAVRVANALYDQVAVLARHEQRSVANMISVLLAEAIKARQTPA